MKGTTNSGNCSGLTHFQASNSRCDAALRHLPPGQPRRHADAVTDEGQTIAAEQHDPNTRTVAG